MGRRKYSGKLKAQVALEALKEEKTIGEIAGVYGSTEILGGMLFFFKSEICVIFLPNSFRGYWEFCDRNVKSIANSVGYCWSDPH